MPAPAPRILVTAGPTHEPIDAVRYLANRSSGRMGEAIAEAATERGASVTLLLGPIPREPDTRWRSSPRFKTTGDLDRLLQEHFPHCDCLIMAAAVADFRPAGEAAGKIRRCEGPLQLRLEPTPDLLAGLARIRTPRQLLVGFALDSAERLDATAREKLERKGLDAVVANPLETMDSDLVRARLHLADGRVLEPAEGGAVDKRTFARWLIGTLWPMIRSPATA